MDHHRGQLIPCHLFDCALPIGYAVDTRVVKGDGNPVSGELRIGFQILKPEIHCVAEGLESVLWGFVSATTVRERDRVLREQIRVKWHQHNTNDANAQLVTMNTWLEKARTEAIVSTLSAYA